MPSPWADRLTAGPTPYYADDAVVIYHADCRDWLPPCDVIATDPPYGIGWGVERNRRSIRAAHGKAFAPIVGDDAPFDPAPLLALGKPTALFGANHYADKLPPSAAWVVWDKRLEMETTHQSDCELVWTNVGGKARMIRYAFNGGGSIGKENGIPAGQGKAVSLHPTQKPIAVMRQLLLWLPPGTVLDPYLGSGTTLVAAKSLGRQAVGIEIEERYCEIAANRCRQETLGLERETARPVFGKSVPCPRCKLTGVVPAHAIGAEAQASQPCPVCRGRGWLPSSPVVNPDPIPWNV